MMMRWVSPRPSWRSWSIGLGVHRFPGLVVALVLAGVANGEIQPAANRYLTRTVDARRQGLTFGVKQSAIPARDATVRAGRSLWLPTLPAGVRRTSGPQC